MADDFTPLASLSLTHVYYNPEDPLSFLCAFLSLLPQALCVVYVTLLWSTREAEVLLMFAGQLACEAVNFALKRLIKEERPKLGAGVGKGYGMPSSHAQFVVFWAVAVSLFLLVRHRPRPSRQERAAAAVVRKGSSEAREQGKRDGTRHGGLAADVSRAYRTGGFPALNTSIEAYAHAPWTLAERGLVSAVVLLVAGLVAWSRVYLGYHTVRQVLAGCAAGAGCAAAWFAVTYLLRETGALAWALELPPARWFRVRDLVVAEDLCQAGWEKWEERRRMALEEERQRERGKEKKDN
ncbi:PAP2 superfamily-domain-containing protein [Achaetomium macrosporum]|uniref:Dolichyldiphosphatase n=1 Tax=Achaetomium macrosporum TaxID=79813 RepID=A0AAN7CA87_9PEZI|nr:PAP2 superfamily-domain-containing protein [Achaetomium macrosporum]